MAFTYYRSRTLKGRNGTKKSKTYKEEYVALQFLFDLTEKESKEIKAKNKKLLSNVIKAKRDFERWCKIVALLEELNVKMGIAL